MEDVVLLCALRLKDLTNTVLENLIVEIRYHLSHVSEDQKQPLITHSSCEIHVAVKREARKIILF